MKLNTDEQKSINNSVNSGLNILQNIFDVPTSNPTGDSRSNTQLSNFEDDNNLELIKLIRQQ